MQLYSYRFRMLCMDKEYLTTKEVCAKLKVCYRTLTKIRKQEIFPAPFKLDGRRLLWSNVLIDKYIEQLSQNANNA